MTCVYHIAVLIGLCPFPIIIVYFIFAAREPEETNDKKKLFEHFRRLFYIIDLNVTFDQITNSSLLMAWTTKHYMRQLLQKTRLFHYEKIVDTWTQYRIAACWYVQMVGKYLMVSIIAINATMETVLVGLWSVWSRWKTILSIISNSLHASSNFYACVHACLFCAKYTIKL